MLSAEQIVGLLNQRFRLLTSGSSELPRHQTLRAMNDWSHDLLDEAEKNLFARLSGLPAVGRLKQPVQSAVVSRSPRKTGCMC